MTDDRARRLRLQSEHEVMQELCRRSSLISFKPVGDPPEEYVVTLRCLGLIDPNRVSDEHIVHIRLPPEYPKEKAPEVTVLSPIYHPNIMSHFQRPDIRQRINAKLASLPTEAERQQLWETILADPDLFRAHVCLDTLDQNWSSSITLDLVCIEIGEMIQFKRYNLADPLNTEAVAWTQANMDNLPVDARNLLDLEAIELIRFFDDDDDTLDIRIL